MPDLLTHSLAAYTLGRSHGDRITAGLVVTGALLPDLLAHVPTKILSTVKSVAYIPRETFFLFAGFHTPFFVLAAAALIVFLLKKDMRFQAFTCLVQGVLLHFFMDLFQRQADGGYMLLFPVSTARFQIGLLWGDYWPYWIPPLFVTALVVELLRSRRPGAAEAEPERSCSP